MLRGFTTIYDDLHKKVIYGFLALFGVLILGIIGYMFIEKDFTLLDAFYMTVITMTTTGFKEVKPLTDQGKIFTVFIIFSGVLAIAYTGGRAAQLLIETQIFRIRRMGKKMQNLSDHYIVCGYGRMGRRVCEELKKNKAKFVVIERDESIINDLKEKNYIYVIGDASNDEILKNAGIANAKGIVTVTHSDAENVFTALTAKQLNPNIYVISRAVDEGSETKLLKAGVDRVVKPFEIGSSKMVQLLLRPKVSDFIEGIARKENINIGLEEVVIANDSPLVGLTLAGSSLRKELNIIIVAIHKVNGDFVYNPSADTIILAGDQLIAIGNNDDLVKLAHLSHGNK